MDEHNQRLQEKAGAAPIKPLDEITEEIQRANKRLDSILTMLDSAISRLGGDPPTSGEDTMRQVISVSFGGIVGRQGDGVNLLHARCDGLERQLERLSTIA
jgi:hypothetical protein